MPASPAWDYYMSAPVPVFLYGYWGLNSAPPACVAGTLPIFAAPTLVVLTKECSFPPGDLGGAVFVCLFSLNHSCLSFLPSRLDKKLLCYCKTRVCPSLSCFHLTLSLPTGFTSDLVWILAHRMTLSQASLADLIFQRLSYR